MGGGVVVELGSQSLFGARLPLAAKPVANQDVAANYRPALRPDGRRRVAGVVALGEGFLPQLDRPQFSPQQAIEGIGKRLGIFYAQNEAEPMVRAVGLRTLIEAIDGVIETRYAAANSQIRLDAFVDQCFQTIITKYGLERIDVIPIDLTHRVAERAERFLAAVEAQRTGQPYPDRETAIAALALVDDGSD